MTTVRYQTIDRCTDPDCRCLDSAGVVLYDGPSAEEAEASMSLAVYPSPEISVVTEGG